METNCGILPFLPLNPKESVEKFLKNQIDTPGSASITQKTIPYFHQTICQWAYNIPLKVNWVLIIQPDDKDYLLKKIAGINATYENKEWDVFNSAIETTLDTVQVPIGCIFAQGVVLPGEDVALEYAGITEGSKRGFINAPIINGRANFQPLEVGFLDTNRSFVDSFLRPWSIVVAHNGLIPSRNSDPTRPSKDSIKATITVHQLARDSRKPTDKDSIIRKTFRFYGCAPINISGETLDYSGGTDFPKLQAKFVYNTYSIDDSVNQNPYRPDAPVYKAPMIMGTDYGTQV